MARSSSPDTTTAILRERTQARTSTTTIATADQADPPAVQQREDNRGQEQQPGHYHGDLAGPVPGTYRVDGQDERARGSGDEQQEPRKSSWFRSTTSPRWLYATARAP